MFYTRFLIDHSIPYKIVTGIVKDSANFCRLINQVKTNIRNSQFYNRPLGQWDEILVFINNNFPIQKLDEDALLHMVVEYAKHGLLNAAHDLDKKIPVDIDTTILLGKIFTGSHAKSERIGDFTYLEKIIKLFKLDLKTLQIPSDESRKFSPLGYATITKQEHRENYIKLLVKKLGLNPNDDIHRSDFQEFIELTPLIMACMKNQLETVELLVRYGADVNLGVVLNDLEAYHTPFSAAVGSRNLKLVEFLLANNADPAKAGAIYKTLNSRLSSFDGRIFVSIGHELLSEEDSEYLQQVFHLIEQHYANQILLAIRQESFEENKLDASENKEDELQTKLDTQKLLEDYIDFRQDPLVKEQEIQQDGKITLESQFYLLLLNFIKSRADGDLKLLYQYIEENPELNLYDSAGLADIEHDQASQIIANKKIILQKYFSAKKLSPTFNPVKHEADKLEGVFKVNSSGLKHTIYVAVDPELEKDEGYLNVKEKILAALDSVKFIKANSKGQHGIKAYKGIVKLKCDDLYLYTNQIYIEEGTENILIMLDNIGRHNKVERAEKLYNTLSKKPVKSFAELLHARAHEGAVDQDLHDPLQINGEQESFGEGELMGDNSETEV